MTKIDINGRNEINAGATDHVSQGPRSTARLGLRGLHSARGFTIFEMVIGLAASLIMTAITIPTARTAMSSYRLSSAAMGAAGAIQSTRYQAIMKGYPFAITFDTATVSYQVSSKPTGAPSFSNVGGTIPLAANAQFTLSATTTLQLNPNGTVSATVGALTFTISNSFSTKTVTVSGVGNVTVTP